MDLRDLENRLTEMCYRLNRVGAQVQASLKVEYDRLIVRIFGLDTSGNQIGHPYNCGHWQKPITALMDSHYWDNALNTAEFLLRNMPITPKQMRFVPGMENLPEDVLENSILLVVTVRNYEEHQLPQEVETMMDKYRRMAEKAHLN